ncbi:MAG TPA: hypothetical protein VHC49_10740 [Mycobacteriales bacterium]|nr:hypothetical protein [Mycobacteriales bacterium]
MKRNCWLPLLLAAVAFVAGCSGSTAPQPHPHATEPPGLTTIRGDQDPLPLTIDRKPLWTIPADVDPLLHKDAVVEDGDRFSVADAETGRVRWSIDRDKPVPGGGGIRLANDALSLKADVRPQIIDLGSDWYVLTDYERSPCWDCLWESKHAPEKGVVALSGADGSVKWTTRLTRSYRFPDDRRFVIPQASLRVASARIAVAVVYPRPDSDAPERAVGLDPRTGRIRWQTEHLWPVQAVGDTIIGYDRAEPFYVDKARVGAYAAGTGKKVWDLHRRYRMSAVENVTGDVVLVGADDRQDGPVDRVLDIHSGKTLVTLPTVNQGCVSDGTSTIGCTYDPDIGTDPHMLTYDVRDRRLTGARAPVNEDYELIGAWHGRFFVEPGYNVPTIGPKHCFAIDATGRRVGPDLPGVPKTIGDGYALVESIDGNTSTIHRTG